MEKRLGTISIILDRHLAPLADINELIVQFGDCVIGRFGLPYPERGVSIITLITESSVERLSAFTGKIGKLPGVQVKSLMAKSRPEGVSNDDPPEQ